MNYFCSNKIYLNKLWYFIIGSSYGFSQWNSVIYVTMELLEFVEKIR